MKSLTILLCVFALIPTIFAASAPTDVRVSPLMNTTWGQTTVGGNSCFNYYTPDSSGYPPVTAGSTSNYPSGCVATAMGQVLNYNQWAKPSYPPLSNFYIKADGTQYQAVIQHGTGAGGVYDFSIMPNIATSLPARQEVGKLIHDLGAFLAMEYYSWANWGSGTDFENIDGALMLMSYTNGLTIEGNTLVLGTLTAQSIAPALAELAIMTNLDAGLPVIIGVNTTNLQSGHALVIDGYGYNSSGTAYFHYNFGMPVQGVTSPATNLGWFTLPGVGTTNDSAGYDVLDGIAFNIFKAPTLPGPTGEIISGRITDSSGNPLSGIQIDITSVVPGFVPVTVYTNANGIFAAYGSIPSLQQYTVTASGAGYQTQSTVCNTSKSFKQWIYTVNPPNPSGHYVNTVGNVQLNMTLQQGIPLPVLGICDMAEYAGFSAYHLTNHALHTDPGSRYDYNADWNVDRADFGRIAMAWLSNPVEFRTEFNIMLDNPGSLPANYPWQNIGGTWTVTNMPNIGAQSPAITHGQTTSFKLPVKVYPGVPGTVDIMFDLSCDTEMSADVFEFLVDGVVQTEMGGSSAFSGFFPSQAMTYQLTGVTGPVLRTLEWRYTKDSANSVGADAVWISNIMVNSQP